MATYRDTDSDGKPHLAPHQLRFFQDPRFRRAMSHAIDRENLVKLMLNGKGEPIYGPTSPANEQWFSDDFVTTPYDIEKAKEILAEMGLKDANGDGILTFSARMNSSPLSKPSAVLEDVEHTTSPPATKNDAAFVSSHSFPSSASTCVCLLPQVSTRS